MMGWYAVIHYDIYKELWCLQSVYGSEKKEQDSKFLYIGWVQIFTRNVENKTNGVG